PAMIEEECLEALLLGADLAEKAAKAGIRALGAGDMGIANTTPSTALYCALLDLDPAEVAGPGTGLDRAGVGRKAGIVAQALEANAAAVASRDPLAVLAALGGLEIACLAGLVLGGAACGLVVCLDGFISTAAYAAARAICPRVEGYCVLSHASAEPGHALAVERLGLEPVLDLGMRLGEGTGAALVLPVLRAAAAVFNRMASFADAGVSESA
ncbi:MAG: nicotinate-nucleotide--dimethylbenzimidazole phosphoribosyltransferase, partial [Desulfovibrionaceae bacterium]|nr:nicotinate-nucleotide--dimethylbenzimidazole phosphoribosyltransferase [Desulfovibrionaceae bacterium]